MDETKHSTTCMEWRSRRGLTQEGASRVLRVTARTWARWETGATPVPEPIAMLMRCMDERDRLLAELGRADDDASNVGRPGADT